MTEPKKRRNNYRGVFPPSLVFLLAVAAGVGLNQIDGMAISLLPGNLVRIVTGCVVLVGGVILVLLAWREFRKNGESFRHRYSTKKVVTTGPYALSRHPAYMGYLLMAVGFGLLRDNVWVLIFAPVAFYYVHAGVVYREERYLVSKFQHAYKRYRMEVARWL